MSDEHAGGVTSRRWFISGRVQGVGFRWFVMRRAEQLEIRGWTRNLADGRVEVLGAGLDENVMRFEAAISKGPTLSRVDNVEKLNVLHETVQDKAFTIR